jgi:hypothetical protein
MLLFFTILYGWIFKKNMSNIRDMIYICLNDCRPIDSVNADRAAINDQLEVSEIFLNSTSKKSLNTEYI